MNTHTLVQGRCQRTYGPCHSAQTLSLRSLIRSERTIWQWTVTPLIRDDTVALSGQVRQLLLPKSWSQIQGYCLLITGTMWGFDLNTYKVICGAWCVLDFLKEKMVAGQSNNVSPISLHKLYFFILSLSVLIFKFPKLNDSSSHQ